MMTGTFLANDLCRVAGRKYRYPQRGRFSWLAYVLGATLLGACWVFVLV